MNFMFFDATREWSGGANRLFLFSRELIRRGHKVVVCTLPDNEMSNRLTEEEIPFFTIEPRSDVNLLVLPLILAKIREYEIDFVDIHSPKFYWLGTFAARVAGKPVTITRNVPFRKTGIKRKLNRFLYSLLADRVLAISDKIKRELLEDYHLDSKKVDVIYDGLETAKFDLPQQPRDRSMVIVGVASRLVFGKGLECFIESIPDVVEHVPESRFVVAGAGPLEDILKKRVGELKLENRVTFTGFRADIPKLFNAFDITVVPSPEEGMSMSALESMASGRPVVATSGGGLVDIISSMETGVIVAPNDPASLAAGVVSLLRADYQAIGNKAKQLVREKFELERVVDRFESLSTVMVGPPC
mgnify:CR=1 FL=1